MCIITNIVRINGNKKCKVKNRVRVALSIEYPPQIHNVNIFPRYGIALKRLVITVAPQKDICPHGSTYPKKAVPISKKKIKIPLIHVNLFLNDLK